MRKIISFLSFIFLTSYLLAQFPEGFEGDVFPPEGWLIADNGIGLDYEWQTTDDAFVGNAAAFIRWEDVADGLAEDWLISPQFTPTTETHILSFFQKKDYAAEYGTLYYVGVTTGAPDDLAAYDALDVQGESDLELVYTYHQVDLSEYIGQAIHIAFLMTNDDGDNWTIDEVNLSSCFAPNGLLVENITTTGADLGWTDDGASSWSVEVVEEGSTPTGTPTVEGLTAPTFTWSGGAPLTSYDFYVRADCGNGDVSGLAGPYTFITACSEGTCAYQLVLTDTYGDNWNGAYIEVRQNGVSMAEFTQAGGGFDPQIFDFSFCHGADFELVWHGGSWDQECIFEFYDPWEQLYHSFGAFEAPEDGVFFSNTASCDPISCRFPFDLKSNNPTINGAELSWTEADNATVWDVEIVPYGDAFTGVATQSDITDIPYVWQGGEPGTYYSFRVRSHCDDGNYSSWSIVAHTFATLCDDVVADFPYDENFNADLFLPDCWTSLLKGSGDYHWRSRQDTYLDEMVVTCKNDRADQDVWLVSPEFDFTTMPNHPVLSFDWKTSHYWMTYPYNKGDLNLRISTDGRLSWTTPIWSEDMVGEYPSFVWQQAEIDLSAYAGMTRVLVAFQYTGNDAATVYLDHFNLKEPGAVVGINEPAIAQDGIVNIYPNPARNWMTIDFQNKNEAPVSLLLMDMMGRKVLTLSESKLHGQDHCTMDLSSMPVGVYFIRMDIGNYTEIRKIVKQ